ncbi:unnamed protein product [Bursaphelenchus xylophilus]|uniref:Transcription initiation factor TFIID subunit 12 n=1 Tax=Bursaphelenchus xylophilus TaxID=6326 RepID=A0A811L390_BURXY|nr:unnamed protein product [Bursaphelenchus xylophilus]CAG9108705.1 unnamed protein product [Bursaphelenchus xylophilus]
MSNFYEMQNNQPNPAFRPQFPGQVRYPPPGMGGNLRLSNSCNPRLFPLMNPQNYSSQYGNNSQQNQSQLMGMLADSPSSSQQPRSEHVQGVPPMYRGQQTPNVNRTMNKVSNPQMQHSSYNQNSYGQQPQPPQGHVPSPGYQQMQYNGQTRMVVRQQVSVESSPQNFAQPSGQRSMTPQLQMNDSPHQRSNGSSQPSSVQSQYNNEEYPAYNQPSNDGQPRPHLVRNVRMTAPNGRGSFVAQAVRYAPPRPGPGNPQMTGRVSVYEYNTTRSESRMIVQQAPGARPENVIINQQPPRSQQFFRPATPNNSLRQALGHDAQQNVIVSQPNTVVRPIFNGQPTFTRRPSVDHGVPSGSIETAPVEDNTESENGEAFPKKAKQPVVVKILKNTPRPPAKKVGKKDGQMGGGQMDDDKPRSHTLIDRKNAVVTREVLDKVTQAMDPPMVLEENVKSGVMMYMESLVDDLVRETVKAATVRKSNEIKTKDIDFVLRKYNITVHGSTGQSSSKKNQALDQRLAVIDRNLKK